MKYEVFVDEGPVSGRLKEQFDTLESATEKAENATDGKYTIYAIDDEFNQTKVASGKGRG